MGTEYEKSSTPGRHSITSNHVLCCADTGRVIAVFYDGADLECLLETLQETHHQDQDQALDANIKSMSAEKGGLHLELEGGACRLLVESFAHQFEKSGAKNYLEMTFHSDNIGSILVTMQRTSGVTPAGKVARMKELIIAGDIEGALAV